MLLCCTFFLALSGAGGSSLEFQRHLHDTHQGAPGSLVACQEAINIVLGAVARDPQGVTARGDDVRLEALSFARGRTAWAGGPIVNAAFRLKARGGEPIRVTAPGGDGDIAVYGRVGKSLYARLSIPIQRHGAVVKFVLPRPGDYILGAPGRVNVKSGLFDFKPTTTDPSARAEWGLFRVNPIEINGPVPVILIHGLSTDRWGEFITWATESPEAASFRERFQVWDFYHGGSGVNVPVGFNRGYPAFEISVVAHLARFIVAAEVNGAVTEGVRSFFPKGAFTLLTHSTGGLKARAFLKNYPEYAARVLAVISIAAPQLGTPFATPEWLRHTFTRLGSPDASMKDRRMQGLLAEGFSHYFFRMDRQSDIDMGWGNFDARGGSGIPYLDFEAWRPFRGFLSLTLSPRDANQTNAPWLPGYDDTTFEPMKRLDTYCGGLDEIMPVSRGEDGLDKFFLYAAYFDDPRDLLDVSSEWLKAYRQPVPISGFERRFQNLGLEIGCVGLGLTASANNEPPLGTYLLNDGIVPLQSALMLDGKETGLIYETRLKDGYRVPVLPFQPRMDIIRQHTLVNPDHVRLFPGWSHLDTATGLLDAKTGHSRLYSMVVDDLLIMSAGLDLE